MSRQVNGVTIQPVPAVGPHFGLAQAVTPSDATPLADGTRGLYIGGAGDVTVIMAQDGKTPITFKAVPVGTLLPIAVNFVMATGTTATNILALF